MAPKGADAHDSDRKTVLHGASAPKLGDRKT